MSAPPFAYGKHDHGRCIKQALSRAEALCRERGVRLTPQRKRVLELIWAGHKPTGAYALLESMGEEGSRPAPPTVYRALEFLLEQGLIHRIERLNAFTGCVQPDTPHDGQFLVCQACGNAAELTDERISRTVSQEAARLGFQAECQTIEISGLCAQCQKTSQ